jgi:hypothetical protein
MRVDIDANKTLIIILCNVFIITFYLKIGLIKIFQNAPICVPATMSQTCSLLLSVNFSVGFVVIRFY